MSQPSEYDRGHDTGYAAGGIAERLASHDRHFEAINGSLDRVARELEKINLGIQQLRDQGKAEGYTRVATAEALKDAGEAQRRNDESRWTPMGRLITLVGGLAAAGALVFGLISTLAR